MEKKTQTQKPNSYLLQQIEIFCTIFFSQIETLKIEISLKIENPNWSCNQCMRRSESRREVTISSERKVNRTNYGWYTWESKISKHEGNKVSTSCWKDDYVCGFEGKKNLEWDLRMFELLAGLRNSDVQ